MSFLRDKTILVVSPESWGKSFVSKHHYAAYLSKHNEVYFLNPPSDISHIKVEHNAHGVKVIDYSGFSRGLRFYPKFLAQRLIDKKFKELELEIEKTIDILWSFDNSVFYDFDALPSRVYTISHIVDLNMNYQFRLSSETADVCFCTTNFLLEKQKKYNSRSFKIGHGYHEVQSNLRFRLQGDYVINVGYLGNLEIKYLDWSTLNEITNRYQEIGYHLVGPRKRNDQEWQEVIEKSNVFWYGEKKPEECASFLKELDCLLIVYKSDEFMEQLAFPHKLMEYLGTGNDMI